ncbi:MAG: carbohydrate kinase family protein [candidate division Zixibacteria bacterium]
MTVSSEKSPRIAVAGHLVYDEIVFPNGTATSAFGGITYNLAAMCAIMTEGRLFPVCEIGSDRREAFDKYFGNLKILDDSFVKHTDKPTVVNRLVYDRSGERKEWNSRIPGHLSLEILPDLADCALLNFISGDDFNPDDLNRFRDSFDGIIYMDYHSLSLGRSPDGSRFFRKHPQWRDYVAVADILQLNLTEISTIHNTRGSDPKSVAESCEGIHDSGPDTIIVTMGENGIVVSANSGGDRFHIPAVRIENEVDATGCGDTLAAVTLYHYLKTDDILKSLKAGSLWAAAKATFSGLDGFADIEKIASRIESNIDPIIL